MPAAAKKGERGHASSIQDLMKQYGSMGISHVERIEKVKRCSTGILSIDLLFRGGLPIGRTVLHYGSEGSGKSTQWMFIARNLMNAGKPVLWFDIERTFDREYALLLGIDVDAMVEAGLLTIIKAQTLEQVVDGLVMALELGHYAMIVIDTWSKLVPGAEAGASISKDQMGVASRLNSRATRVWGKALDESGAVLVVLNQERTDLGAYGAPSVSSGGKALMKHEPSIILYSQKRNKDNLYLNDRPTRLIFRYTVKKSKVFPFAPHVSLDDYYQLHIKCAPDAYEIDFPHELYAAATQLHLLEDKDGHVWKANNAFFQGEKLGNGEKQVEGFFADKTPLRDQIEAMVYARMEEGKYGDQGSAAVVHDDPAGDPGPTGEEDAPDID